MTQTPTTPTIRERAFSLLAQELTHREDGKKPQLHPNSLWNAKLLHLTEQIITLTQEETREKILAALPKEMTMDAANKSGSDAGAGYTIGHNAAIKEARTAITNLDLSV